MFKYVVESTSALSIVSQKRCWFNKAEFTLEQRNAGQDNQDSNYLTFASGRTSGLQEFRSLRSFFGILRTITSSSAEGHPHAARPMDVCSSLRRSSEGRRILAGSAECCLSLRRTVDGRALTARGSVAWRSTPRSSVERRSFITGTEERRPLTTGSVEGCVLRTGPVEGRFTLRRWVEGRLISSLRRPVEWREV